ncbi:Glycoside hydrolase subgroup catalytic core [Paragonimus heterotremus]|uniref:Glycoside hydrolase subgroup catalytic core n=1 Tax=Paragonimus heterotremus TaxID=100268 RepID=A0A8J4SLS1_9TREM|nr:Glycoside hydrolase subgroup catalytic core [Paragonimus heterotremus]
MLLNSFKCFLLVLTAPLAFSLDKVQLDSEGNFVNPQGQKILFHGFNSVTKRAPWYFSQLTNRTKLQMYKDWGINIIRLGVMWAGVVPEQSVVDEAYLEKIEEIVDLCAEYGIYLLLDMHQDVLSTAFGTYDGIPRWLVDQLPKPPKLFSYPFPFMKPPREWFENYLTYAAVDCAQKIYENSTGAWVHWGDFWSVVAKRFVNKSNVLGYELINEPPTGNFYTNPARVLPSYMGKNYLLPVYDYLVNRIREVDNKTLIFYQPITYGIFLPVYGNLIGTGFDRVPGIKSDPAAQQKSVLSYHYYCWLLQTGDPSKEMPSWKQKICDELLMESVFNNARESSRTSGGGMFLTEFGLCAPDGNEKSVNTIECNTVLNKADAHFQSWTYWDGNFIDSTGNPVPTQVRSFSRAYPRHTYGTPQLMKFNVETGEFDYQFVTTPTQFEQVNATEIFIPNKVHYPNGVNVEVSPASVRSRIDGDLLVLSIPEGSTQLPISIHVKITAK